MMRKGEVKRLDGRDRTGQATFVNSLFQIAAREKVASDPLRSMIIFATLPFIERTITARTA